MKSLSPWASLCFLGALFLFSLKHILFISSISSSPVQWVTWTKVWDSSTCFWLSACPAVSKHRALAAEAAKGWRRDGWQLGGTSVLFSHNPSTWVNWLLVADWWNECQFQSQKKSWQVHTSYLVVTLWEILGILQAVNLISCSETLHQCLHTGNCFRLRLFPAVACVC